MDFGHIPGSRLHSARPQTPAPALHQHYVLNYKLAEVTSALALVCHRRRQARHGCAIQKERIEGETQRPVTRYSYQQKDKYRGVSDIKGHLENLKFRCLILSGFFCCFWNTLPNRFPEVIGTLNSSPRLHSPPVPQKNRLHYKTGGWPAYYLADWLCNFLFFVSTALKTYFIQA